MPEDFCPGCGLWGCHGECDPDYEQTCDWCGEPGCPGYCDDHQTYNLRGFGEGEAAS